MTNRYYNHSSFVAAPNSLIRSQSHLQQYASVADGFAAVETEMDTKADANSPTIFDAVLTGDVDASTALTVAVPTVSLRHRPVAGRQHRLRDRSHRRVRLDASAADRTQAGRSK